MHSADINDGFLLKNIHTVVPINCEIGRRHFSNLMRIDVDIKQIVLPETSKSAY